jgi:hypothetical protein
MRTSFKQVVNSGDSEESEVPALLNATRRVTPVKLMMINLERGKDEGIVTMINGTRPFVQSSVTQLSCSG